MTAASAVSFKQILSVRWNPGRDLAVVALSWVLVVGALYTATVIVGTAPWDGMAYFFLYAVVSATLFGLGIPLYWMTVVRRRPIAGLGLTTKRVGVSLVVQLILATLLYFATLAKVELPPADMSESLLHWTTLTAIERMIFRPEA
jgi:hypothetical protein